MSMRNGTRRCWTTGTMAAASPELKGPTSTWAPALISRSASGRATSGLLWVSPSSSSSFAPPSDLMPSAALTASAAIWAPSRQACPGSDRGPVTVWMTPIFTVGACARSTAGKPSEAAPAAAPLSNVRRPMAMIPPLLEQLAGDDDALDLVRALVDLHDLGVAHEALDRELPRVADAAKDLHRVSGDPHGGVAGEAL